MIFYRQSRFFNNIYLFLIKLCIFAKNGIPSIAAKSSTIIHVWCAYAMLTSIHGQSTVFAHSQSFSNSNISLSSSNSPSSYYRHVPSVVSVKPSLSAASFPSSTSPSTSLPSPPVSSSLSHSTFSTATQNYAILDLTSDLNLQLKSIQEQELLVSTIQNTFDSFDRTTSTIEHNDTKVIVQLAAKVDMKLSSAMHVVNQIHHKILEILSEMKNSSSQSSSNIKSSSNSKSSIFFESIVLPCTPYSERTTTTAISYDDHLAELKLSDNYIGGIDKKKTLEILNFLKNAGHLHETDDKNFTTNKRLMETIKMVDLTSTNVPNFRDAFFLAMDNYGSASNCRNNFPNDRYRYLFASVIKSKKILMVVDHGASAANEELLELIKSFAQNIIDLLNENDHLKIVSVSNVAKSLDSYHPKSMKQLYPATLENKKYFRKFIESLNKTADITNHTLAFEYAFELANDVMNSQNFLLNKQTNEKSTPLLMLYISRGLVTQISEAKAVLETIAAGQKHLKQPILINTCAVMGIYALDEKRIMYEKQFLNDIATQNYTKYGVEVSNDSVSSWHNRLLAYGQSGKLFLVNKRLLSDVLATATAAITDVWFQPSQLRTTLEVHPPIYDRIVKEQIISITQPCSTHGIVGVSLFLADLTEDLIYYFDRYSNGDQSYAFLFNVNGLTVWHPSFPRPHIASNDDNYPTDVKYFEKVGDSIVQRWLSDVRGSVKVKDDTKTKIYTWRHLSRWYVVCIVRVLSSSKAIAHRAKDVTSSVHIRETPIPLPAMDNNGYETSNSSGNDNHEFSTDIVFHRLDLTIATKLRSANEKSPTLCQYFKQISIMDTPTLFLSPGCFKSPFQHLETMCKTYEAKCNENGVDCEKCQHRVENIMAYIKDTTNLLTNPGLQPHVRSDVLVFAHFIDLLRAQHNSVDSKVGKYVIRRYITSLSGIVLIYPGFVMPNDFEPTRRPWFKEAIQNAGKLAITAPYLDVGGAGFIITISHTIYEPSHTNKHRNKRRRRSKHFNKDHHEIAAVVSIDVTPGFLYQMLLESSEHCRSDAHVKCFLIDDMGYLVVHPSILEPKLQSADIQTSDNDHITHRESLIANDILLHRNLVEKRLCQNLLNRKIQRYYKFNTSVSDVLTNVVNVNGERSKYQITTVSNTNLFVVMLNSTDGEGGAAFCPCSTVDKFCFNCKRIELMNCECPCECSLDELTTASSVNEYMYGDLLDGDNILDKNINLFESIDICPSPIEEFHPIKRYSMDNTNRFGAMGACVNFTCELYTNHLDCLGILGCEWCQVDIDGETLLPSPFCTHQSVCFGGILGSTTPYGDGDIGADLIDSILPSAYAAIGPVAGAIIVLFLIIGFAMYCFRHNLEPGSEQLYIESLPVEHNFGLPLSRLDYDSISPHNGSDVMDKANNTSAVPSDMSPYRMHAGNFRRPNGESDHGYSTMTPHEDSDHACFTLIEPLIKNKSSNMSISDSTSINADPIATNLSSPLSYRQNSVGKLKDSFATTATNNYYDNNGATLLSSPHHIQAPVTVHHPMEATL